MDELDRTLQNEWTERIPNRRYARIDPVVSAATPSGNFAGELFDETQPLPVSGTRAPGFAAAFGDRRHRPLLLLDLYAVVLIAVAVGMSLRFVHNFDPMAGWQQNRISLLGTSAILAFVSAFCFQSSGKLWGRFNFESVLIWVEMIGSYQTSRIGTGNNFSSRMNTENDVVRTEAMTLRIWRSRIESVVFGKDDARQVTAMFSTEKEATALAAHLVQFARSQSVLVSPGSSEDQGRIAALNASERALTGAAEAPSAAQISHQLQTAAALGSPPSAATAGVDLDLGLPSAAVHCSRCGTLAPAGARFCARCGAQLATPA
jgi:hypothetical protein